MADSEPFVPSLLAEAEELVNGRRRQDYGDVGYSFAHVADVWSAILEVHVTPQQFGLCMIALKMTRYGHGRTRDSLVDIAGYAACLARIDEEAGLI